MDLRKLLISFIPGFEAVELAPLLWEKEIVGWEAILIDRDKNVLGGAISDSKEKCIQIAYAETLERYFVKNLNIRDQQRFLTDLYPTSCGFAFGFEEKGTYNRAFNEALERWVWSKWIDEHFLLAKRDGATIKHTSLASYFVDAFDEVLFFSREFDLDHLGGGRRQIGITIGLFENGAFAGSKVSMIGEDVWTHALSESFRHKNLYLKIRDHHKSDEGVVKNRLIYFGAHQKEAIDQIDKMALEEWPRPEILLQKRVELPFESLFLYRILFENFMSWHLGEEKRFVY